jgi:hypothetical protein
MGWSIGYDSNWKRDIGYGVPAICDHPECSAEINRGLSYVCGGEPYGGERGCGLFFCSKHLYLPMRRPQLCEKCEKRRKPFQLKADTPEWIKWKLTDSSWSDWRLQNHDAVDELRKQISEQIKKVCP